MNWRASVLRVCFGFRASYFGFLVSRLSFAVLLFALVLPVAAWGESGQIHTRSAYGLNLAIDGRWVAGGGYRPVRIKVTPTVPVVADRVLSVEFHAGRFSRDTPDIRVTQRIDIPEGLLPGQTVEATLSVPPNVAVEYRVLVFEDGKPLTALCQPVWTSCQEAWGATFEGLPRVLVVGNVLPSTTEFTEALLGGVNRAQLGLAGNPNVPVPVGASVPTAVSWPFLARPPAELPSRWIDYSSVDLVCLSLQELTSLEQKRPDAFHAILHWTAAGGNLVVYNANKNWREWLREVDVLVGLPPGPRAGKERSPSDWTAPERGMFNRPLMIPELVQAGINQAYSPYYQPTATTMPVQPVNPNPTPQPPSKPPDDAPFRYRRYHLGMIVALASKAPFAEMSRYEWNWVFNAIGPDRWLWHQRHGLSLVEDNPDFWNFLIPGVGLAPVFSFEVLITLFVVAIGPANYFLLRRWKRLHLLVVTVPLSAAAITLTLFGYALVSDGLGTRVRVRSVTMIDQRQGQAACWSRLSYYAGLAPAGGLSFPDDVMVVPLDAQPMERTSRGRSVVWAGDAREQWMASGWLPSRTPTQFLTVRARPTAAGLQFLPQGNSGGPEVRNALGCDLRQALICSEKGEYYWIEDLSDGRAAAAQPVELAVALQRLRATCQQADPRPLPGMSPQLMGPNYSRGRRFYGRYFGAYQSSGQTASSRTGRLESVLWALSTGAADKEGLLAPGSYAAIVERSPETLLGNPAAKEEAGFHVVVGKW